MARYLVNYEYRKGDDEAVLIWDDSNNKFEYDTEFVSIQDLLEYLLDYSNELRSVVETVFGVEDDDEILD